MTNDGAKTLNLSHTLYKITLSHGGEKSPLSSSEFTSVYVHSNVILLPNRESKFYFDVLNSTHLLPCMDSWLSVSTGISHSCHFSPLSRTEVLQSRVAAALPDASSTMGEATEFDRLGTNSVHEN